MNIPSIGHNSKSSRANFYRAKDMWVKQVLASNVSPTAKNIGIAISIHVHADKRQAWPSHSVLAKMCSVEKRTSERAVHELESAGLLRVSRVPNRSNRYEMRRLPTGESVGTDEDDTRVPTEMVPPPDEYGTTPPTGMSPEPLSITSYRTSYIEPLREPLKERKKEEEEAAPPAAFGNAVVAAPNAGKESGEGSEPKISVGEPLARLVKERRWA